MVALSPPIHLLRCMAPDAKRPGSLCGYKFARVAAPYFRVQDGGLPLICPRCEAVQRFAPVAQAA